MQGKLGEGEKRKKSEAMMTVVVVDGMLAEHHYCRLSVYVGGGACL